MKQAACACNVQAPNLHRRFPRCNDGESDATKSPAALPCRNPDPDHAGGIAEHRQRNKACATPWPPLGKTHPTARALSARQDEFTARHEAANSLLAGAPTAGLSNRERSPAARRRAARMGGGITLPSGCRDTRHTHAGTGSNASNPPLPRWWRSAAGNSPARSARLGGRPCWPPTSGTSRARAESTRQLASDVERRVRAGDLPRMDANQARSAEAATEGVLAETDGRAHRAARTYLALTGQPALPAREGMHEQRQKPDPDPRPSTRSWRRWSGPSLLRARASRSPPKRARPPGTDVRHAARACGE